MNILGSFKPWITFIRISFVTALSIDLSIILPLLIIGTTLRHLVLELQMVCPTSSRDVWIQLVLPSGSPPSFILRLIDTPPVVYICTLRCHFSFLPMPLTHSEIFCLQGFEEAVLSPLQEFFVTVRSLLLTLCLLRCSLTRDIFTWALPWVMEKLTSLPIWSFHHCDELAPLSPFLDRSLQLWHPLRLPDDEAILRGLPPTPRWEQSSLRDSL